MPIVEADTGDSLSKKVGAAMCLPGASLLLYLSSDGTPIEARATLAAQGIGIGAELVVTVEEMHSYTQATLHGHTDYVRAVTIHPDGRIVSGSNDNTLRIWSAHGEHQATLQGHTDKVWAVAIHPDGRIVSGSSDKTLRIWA